MCLSTYAARPTRLPACSRSVNQALTVCHIPLQACGDISYSIVRPTAFFKSLAGQIELVKQGKPYVMFGDGNLAACKPISEADLAAFMADCVQARDKVRVGRVIDL